MEIIFKNSSGKMVGRLDGVNYSTLRNPKHFMRMFNGFGISQKIIDELKKGGCRNIIINYSGKKNYVYSCSLDLFVNSKKVFTFEGNDLQRFVSVTDMVEKILEEMP